MILEWKSICEQFIKDYQSKHKWNEAYSLWKMWKNIVSTKYLNLALIEKCIEMLPKLSIESRTDICELMSMNPVLTIDIVLAYPEFPSDFYEISKNMNISNMTAHSELKWNWNMVKGSIKHVIPYTSTDVPCRKCTGSDRKLFFQQSYM